MRVLSSGRLHPFAFLSLLPTVLLLLAGCAASRLGHTDAFFAGRLDESEQIIRAQAADSDHAIDVLTLDRASVLMARGEPRRAERLLRVVRDRWDYLEQQSLAESAASVATDDRAKAYAGEEFERVLLRSMLTIANLTDDGGDAYAYSLQAAAKQRQLEELGLPPLAVVPFLSAVVRADTRLHAAEAGRSWNRFVRLTDEAQLAVPPVQLASHVKPPRPDALPEPTDAAMARGPFAVPPRPGMGRVCVFCFVGRGPRKVASAVDVGPSAGVMIEGLAVQADMTVEIPTYIGWGGPPPPVVVRADGVEHPGRPVLRVTDVARVESDRQRDALIQKAAARAAAKTAVAGTAMVVADANDEPALALLAGLALAASRTAERCDVRHWSCLPDRIDTVWLELPAGEQSLTIIHGGHTATVPVRVRGGRTVSGALWLTDAGPLGQPSGFGL